MLHACIFHVQAISLAVHARTYHAHMRELEALLRVLMSFRFLYMWELWALLHAPISHADTHELEALLRVSVNFICLHVRAISPAIHARLYSPALRRLQSRGVRACSTYIRCYMFITWIMHVVPWQFFDAKSIVDHSVYSMHRKAATIYHGNASRYMGTATNTPPHLLHTHALRR